MLRVQSGYTERNQKNESAKKEISAGFAGTFNFDYSKKQAEQLIAMTEFNIIYVSEIIKEIMREKIEKKRKYRGIITNF